MTKRGTKRNQSTTSARKRDGSLDFLLPILLLKTEYNLIFDINDIFLGYKISYKFDLQSSWDYSLAFKSYELNVKLKPYSSNYYYTE